MNDDLSQSPNPHRLYKNKRLAVVSGVCAGIADYLNADVVLVRIAAVLSLIFFPPFTLIGYVVAAIAMPTRPRTGQPLSEEEAKFWSGVARRPEATFSNIKYRFRDMDARLADIERVVTSNEWRLRREFRNIE